MDNHDKKSIYTLLAGIAVFSLVIALMILYFRQFSDASAGQAERCPVRLSEVMSSNDAFPAQDGLYYDWVEVYNTTANLLDLSGWGLSDRADDVKYVFPKGTLLPGKGYLAVWCSKTADRDDMAPFGISADGGESVCLFDPDGALVDETEVPALGEGHSWQRGADGSWAITAQPTPGEKNILSETLAAPRTDCTVVINELMAAGRIGLRDEDGEYSDWAELYNTGDKAWDLTGWYLSDDPDKSAKWEIPELTLAPGEYKIIFCSGKDRRSGELHTGFALSKSGGGLYLFDPDGAPAAELVYTAMERDQVCRRTENGAEYSYDATPGYGNDADGYEAYVAAADVHGDLVINEVTAYYNGKFTDGRKRSYDWLELKNVGSETINLKGWTLTNSAEEPDRCPLPDVKLKPGALYIVFCAKDVALKDGSHVYAPFNISSQGERLYLFDPEGKLSDSVFVRDLPYAGSIGRMNGGQGFYLFETPTPTKENDGGCRFKSAAVTADRASGIYNDVESVVVALSGEGDIRYTLDGSVPTVKSTLYTEPLKLDKTSVIRAVSFAGGKIPSDTSSFSYIINENHALPVMSLICNPRDYLKLIRTTGLKINIDGFAALYNDQGAEFERGCSIRLHGNTSRFFREKKMFTLEFNGRFGGNLVYDVFGDGRATEYSSLLLRGETARFGYIIKDSLASLVANEVCDTALTLNNRYTILYINGKYYGIYPLREDYSKQYVASHTGSSLESCRVEKGPVKYDTPSSSDIYDLLNFICNCDMSNKEYYAQAAEKLDMEAMADWMLLEGYFGNRDIGGNVRYIYGDNTGGKWRPGFFDLDISVANENPEFGMVIAGGDQVQVVINSLLRSDEFREIAAQRMAKMLDAGLGDNVALELLEGVFNDITPEIDRDNKRLRLNIIPWTREMDIYRRCFSDERIQKFIDEVAKILKLSEERKQELYGAYIK